MRVLQVIPSVSPLRGGPSKAVIDMTRALIAKGVNVEIATTNDDGPNKLDVTTKELIDFSDVPVRFFERWSPTIESLREFAVSRSFSSWLKEHIDNYDVVHIHAIFSFTSSYTMWLARKKGIPYVVRPIGQLESWSLAQSKLRKKVFLALFERKNLAAAAAIHYTAASEQAQAAKNIKQLDSKLGVVIPLGIAKPELIQGAKSKLHHVYKIKKDRIVFLYLSRLHKKKGLELLLQAFSRVDQTKWSLIVAGEGSKEYTESINSKIKSLNLENNCQMVGFAVGEKKELLLQGSDFYTLTSYSENFGIAVLEALVSGTKTIVSHEVALSEFVASKDLGYVCELSMDAIEKVLNTSLNQSTYDSNNISSVALDSFGWPKIASQLKELYRSLAQ